MSDARLQQALGQHQIQTLRAEQITGLSLLQMPIFDLQMAVDEMVERNPVLTTDVADAEHPTLSSDDPHWMEEILALPADQRYIHNSNTVADDETREFILNSVVQHKSLHEYLQEQCDLLTLSVEQKKAVNIVLEYLDSEGYLKTSFADIEMSTHLPQHVLERALKIVQSLDPPGIGARDSRERLLLKLARAGRRHELIYSVVRDSLDDLAHNRIPQLAEKWKVSVETIYDLRDEIQALRTDLDYCETEEVLPTLSPEVVVTLNAQGEPEARVLNDRLPHVYISSAYKKMLADARTPEDARVYIREKIKDAATFIQSLLQRQSTLKRIADAIVQKQRDYFVEGPEALKPLTRAEIAAMCDCHTSTVGRTVDSKMLECSWGKMMMSQLFTGMVPRKNVEPERVTENAPTSAADAVGTQVILNAIQKIVDEEPPQKPLSDAKILEILQSQGFTVARRTIAKYREMLHIQPSHLRKTFLP